MRKKKIIILNIIVVCWVLLAFGLALLTIAAGTYCAGSYNIFDKLILAGSWASIGCFSIITISIMLYPRKDEDDLDGT